MNSKMTDFLYSKSFVFIVAVVISILCYHAANNNLFASEKMIKSHFDFEMIDDFKIALREDEYFKYINITNSGRKENLNVNVKNGIISISSDFRSEKKEGGDNFQSYSSIASSYSKKLLVPAGVDDRKAEVLTSENNNVEKITIKFPKIIIST